MNFIRKKRVVEDVLLQQRTDRRLLSNVLDKKKSRTNIDRRGKKLSRDFQGKIKDIIDSKKEGIRYQVSYNVKVICFNENEKKTFYCKAVDISATGILLNLFHKERLEYISNASKVILKFKILPGTMPEGYEMKVKIEAQVVRSQIKSENEVFCGLQFKETLTQYVNNKKDRFVLLISSILLFLITAFIVLMRAESVVYFRFNKYLYLYSIIAATFLLSRYLFGAMYKAVPVDMDYTPGVSIIIPCFNEEKWIQKTILSCINQDYPLDKLEVIIVDDCSTDGSVAKIKEIVEKLYQEDEYYDTKNRVRYFVQEQNKGKREALIKGALVAKHDLLVFVDSDSFLDSFAIRNLVQPFKDPKMGGVTGRTDVANTFTNGLTKMQSVRYYIAFRIMKAAEAYFDAVTCLSGPLSCYRKKIVLEHKDEWLNQRFLGCPATFGDDRSMTNFVLRNHRTSYQDTAVCSTIVPNDYGVFLKQQMRWKRSWLRESIIASKFMWKKEPFMALFFYMGLLVPIAAPIVVLYNLIYVPLVYKIFPTTFLVGILMMSFLMSAAQMFLRKSSTWIFGMLFCFYYEVVLLWQMPIAWVTFWKSTWGTRPTPQDIIEQEKKNKRKQKKMKKVEEN
ncbi:glycosyltransferase [Caloramator sp. E03]|uniref:glycosyltransferase n=1 Tax=Caloramator sp. E03 TaxID=2576307 RepID=UPI00111018E3|nr:glycosyltransferase [Caloramator sp. E03]QCX34690.1 glycosyltransferase [Caloramator sp. E03]